MLQEEPPSIAAPVRDSSGNVVAALATAASNIDDVLAPLLAHATQISSTLGYQTSELDSRVSGHVL